MLHCNGQENNILIKYRSTQLHLHHLGIIYLSSVRNKDRHKKKSDVVCFSIAEGTETCDVHYAWQTLHILDKVLRRKHISSKQSALGHGYWKIKLKMIASVNGLIWEKRRITEEIRVQVSIYHGSTQRLIAVQKICMQCNLYQPRERKSVSSIDCHIGWNVVPLFQQINNVNIKVDVLSVCLIPSTWNHINEKIVTFSSLFFLPLKLNLFYTS